MAQIKLSSVQLEVLKLLKEGWELGVDIYTIGHTVIARRARMQKYGLGHGDPYKSFNVRIIDALERKGLIKHLPNNYSMFEPTRYILTEEGKEYETN